MGSSQVVMRSARKKEGERKGAGRREGREEAGRKEKLGRRARKGVCPCLGLALFEPVLCAHSPPGQSTIHHCWLPMETVMSFNSLFPACWELMEDLSLSPILELVENQSAGIASFTITLGNKV